MPIELIGRVPLKLLPLKAFPEGKIDLAMPTTETTIFSNTLDPTVENYSDTFLGAIGFYLIAPSLTSEVEIDIFLQVNFSPTIIRLVKLEPLNISNTERLTLIPAELRELSVPMRLLILPSQAFFLEIILVKVTYNDALKDEIIDTLSNLIITSLLP